MDSVNFYRGGSQKKHISQQEIEEMKKNMKKVPVIELQAEIYHNQETQDVESILKKIPKTENNHIKTTDDDIITHYTWLQTLRNRLKKIFISSS